MINFLKLILYQPLFNALIFFVWLIPGNNVGLAIIVLTIIIRLILLPSSLNSLRQQRRTRELQPKLQEIQTKYKDDKQKLAEEISKFYRENKINPLGACLPLLLQLPILIVLYYVFINGLDTHRFDLLYSWMPRPETIKTMFLGLDLSKPDRWVLPILAGALQLFNGWQISSKVKTEEGKEQQMAQMMSKQMMYLMPIFTVFIAGRFPAALPLYWIVTTLFQIGQQWWVDREEPGETSKIQKSKVENRKKSKIEKLEGKTVKKGVEITVRKKKK